MQSLSFSSNLSAFASPQSMSQLPPDIRKLFLVGEIGNDLDWSFVNGIHETELLSDGGVYGGSQSYSTRCDNDDLTP